MLHQFFCLFSPWLYLALPPYIQCQEANLRAGCEKRWHWPFEKSVLSTQGVRGTIHQNNTPAYYLKSRKTNLPLIPCSERCRLHIYNSKHVEINKKSEYKEFKITHAGVTSCRVARQLSIYKVHWDSRMRLVWTKSSSSILHTTTANEAERREERSRAY